MVGSIREHLRHEVDTVGNDRVRRPIRQRFEQQPVRAADVHEVAGPVDRVGDAAPLQLPALGAGRTSREPVRIGRIREIELADPFPQVIEE